MGIKFQREMVKFENIFEIRSSVFIKIQKIGNIKNEKIVFGSDSDKSREMDDSENRRRVERVESEICTIG